MGRLKGDVPKRGRKMTRDWLDLRIYRHSSHSTGVCKYWQRNPKWQVPPYMVGEGETAGVLCDSMSACESCGWNPAVYEKRMKELRGQ